MSKLTALCRGQPCYIRLPEICNSTPENSSPAHLRLIGVSGMGLKAPDIFVCPACPNCHDAVDRRRYIELDRDYAQLAHYQAVMRWQYELYKRELICEGVGA
jgi:hypothetical protein